jgi:hypothetical protein
MHRSVTTTDTLFSQEKAGIEAASDVFLRSTVRNLSGQGGEFFVINEKDQHGMWETGIRNLVGNGFTLLIMEADERLCLIT